MIVYGVRTSKIGNFSVKGGQCNTCKFDAPQDFAVYGRYFHVFWIPVIPTGRKAVVECSNCKITLPQDEFSPTLQQQYENHKDEVKRPLRHWAVLGLLGLFFLSSFF